MASESLVIAPADPGEYAAIGALTVAAYQPSGMAADDPYFDVLRDVAARVAAGCTVLVARQADAAIGTVTWAPSGSPFCDISGPGESEMRILAVAPAQQRQGVGRALTTACLDLATNAGDRALVLSTATWMTKAHRMYEQLGFTRLPERDWSAHAGLRLLAYALQLPGARS